VKWQLLSHSLNPSTPAYAGGEGFQILSRREISQGSRGQTWKFTNHLGTHVDFPAHFVARGATLSDMLADDFIFDRVCLFSVPLRRGRLLDPADIEWERIPKSTEMLLLRTGFEKQRTKSAYIFEGPGIHPDLCAAMRERIPRLRALGFDFISLTSFRERELGREAHRVFLKPDRQGRAPWIIEDMRLSGLRARPRQVVVAPLLVEGADGSPVTVFAR
jgi:kynurenine formamidase